MAYKTVVKKNKRTGKYQEKEVETGKGGSSGINLQKSYSDNWDEGLYSYSPTKEQPKIKDLTEAKTIQDYLDWKYPTKEDKEKVKKIGINKINIKRAKSLKMKVTNVGKLEGGSLDLSKYSNLKEVFIPGTKLKTPIIDLILGNKPQLAFLNCSENDIISLDISNCPNLKKIIKDWKTEEISQSYNQNIEITHEKKY